MITLNIHYCVEDRKDFFKLSPFASRPGAMINPQWLELPISRTNFHGPKDVRATDVRLYMCGVYGGWGSGERGAGLN